MFSIKNIIVKTLKMIRLG